VLVDSAMGQVYGNSAQDKGGNWQTALAGTWPVRPGLGYAIELWVPCVGEWLGSSSVLKMRHVNTGDLDTALYFCRRARVLKKGVQRRKDPPYLSLTRVTFLSPSHWSGQGAHSSRWPIETNCCWEKKERGGRRRRRFQLKPEHNGLAKISLDRKDVMLLSTPVVTVHFPNGQRCRKHWMIESSILAGERADSGDFRNCPERKESASSIAMLMCRLLWCWSPSGEGRTLSRWPKLKIPFPPERVVPGGWRGDDV